MGVNATSVTGGPLSVSAVYFETGALSEIDGALLPDIGANRFECYPEVPPEKADYCDTTTKRF